MILIAGFSLTRGDQRDSSRFEQYAIGVKIRDLVALAQ